MSAGAIAAIIVAIVLVVLIIGVLSTVRRRRLRQRFGPEYDRVVGEKHSHRKAGAELAERERRVRGLDIHPLDETARAKYAGEWVAIQERFVDQPEEAAAQAGMVVTAVMADRGYPTDDYEQVLADLSVEHANTLDHYRAAHQVSLRAETGTASTEDLRLAMLHYRALFGDLLGQPDARSPGTAAPSEPLGPSGAAAPSQSPGPSGPAGFSGAPASSGPAGTSGPAPSAPRTGAAS